MPDRQISIWNRNQLYVDAHLKESGDLIISGQDLSGAVYAEYEYVLTVRKPDVVRVVAALGGSPGADVLGLLESHAGSIIKTGEKTWLESHDIPAEFWNRVEP